MKPKQLIAIGTMALAGQFAHAQGSSGGVGGGGDLLVCKQNGRETRTLLDIKEGLDFGNEITKTPFRFQIPQGSTLEEGFAIAIERLAMVDPERAQRYLAEGLIIIHELRKLSVNPNAETALVKKALLPLKDIDDSDETYDYSQQGCKKFQMVRQETNPITNQIQYTFDLGLFWSMDVANQVATLTHELIYKEVRETGARTSRSARIYNRMILDQTIQTAKVCTYVEQVKSFGLKDTYYAGISPTSDSRIAKTCDESGQLTSLSVPPGTPSLPIKVAGYTFEAESVQFRGGVHMISGESGFSSTTWDLSEDHRTLTQNKNGFHRIHFKINDNGTSEIKLYELYSNGRHLITLVNSGDGQVLSYQYYQFNRQSLSVETQKAVENFVQKLKERIALLGDGTPSQQFALKVDAVRSLIPQNRALEIQQITASLDQNLTNSTVVPSENAKHFVSSLQTPWLVNCTTTSSGVTIVAVVGGAEAKFQKVKCLLSNGDHLNFKTRLAISPMYGFAGFSVDAGRMTRINAKGNSDFRQLRYRDDAVDTIFAIGPAFIGGNKYDSEDMKLRIRPRMGFALLNFAVTMDRKAILKKQVPGIELPVSMIQKEIVIPVNQ